MLLLGSEAHTCSLVKPGEVGLEAGRGGQGASPPVLSMSGPHVSR